MSASAIVHPEPRTYAIRTLGCQMNAHDSERMAGLLEEAGYVRAAGGMALGPDGEPTSLPDADVVVINTCAVRENAATRLYGNLGQLARVKAAHPGMQIAVGGCLAQKDREQILERAPWVDVVFGTHTIGALPALLARAAHNREAQIEIAEALTVFPSTLPTRRESVYAGWVSISVGCNNTCTFCIVPSLRGKERDRRPGEIVAEIEALVADGVIEVTLLGQNVNTYGAEFAERGAFASLLRAAGAVPGLERVRFTSPHPAAFTDDVVAAMAEVPTVMPSLHMPLQSGSDAVLRAMRRSYRRDRFLAILGRVREAIPDAAISTDVIVGFPGETEADFCETLDVVREARFASAFTFQYSPRPGTPAADMPGQVPPEVMGERYRRLVALQESISEAENRAQVGRVVEVIVSDAPGRKDAATHRSSGRARDGRLVHIGCPGGGGRTVRSLDGPRDDAAGAAGGSGWVGGAGAQGDCGTPDPRGGRPGAAGGSGWVGGAGAQGDNRMSGPRERAAGAVGGSGWVGGAGGSGRVDRPEAHGDSGMPGSRERGAAPTGAPRPGDIVRVTVTGSAPHHLIADSPLSDGWTEVHRTRAGDAWEARSRETADGVPPARVFLPPGVRTRRPQLP